MKIDTSKLTIANFKQTIETTGSSVVEVVENYLARIEEKKSLNAFLGLYKNVLSEAAEADAKIARQENLPLLGVPIALKDNILVEGEKMTAGSKILADFTATYDATVVARLKAAGAVLVGRTNLDEFAMGGSTENSAFGVTKNPFDDTRVAGGSSGGSAAAVGADLSLCALGSDTGGSVRQPASFCGVVGLKPTYGTVSRSGVVAMASSLDQIGPVTKTVTDAEILYQVIAGKDVMDSTSLDRVTDEPLPAVFTVGIPVDFLAEGVDSEVMSAFNETVRKLKESGVIVKEISLPNIKYSLASYYILMPAESSTNLGRFDGLRYGSLKEGQNLLEEYMKTRGEGFGEEVRRRIILGTYVLSAGYFDAYYGKATAVRELIKQDYLNAFSKDGFGVDVILTPTAPTPAWKIGSKVDDPLQMYLEDIFTVPVNLAGVPAMSIPGGKTEAGLPIGIQLTAKHFGENNLFALGKMIENLQ